MKQPYLILTGDNAWSRPASEELYNSMKNKKKLHIVKGAGHFDMYDLEQYVTENMEQISAWFKEHLK